MPRIFSPFEQGEQTKTRRFGGLGLGLSIAKAVMDLHQGTLTCTSAGKDQGAVFTVELATVEPPPAPSPSAPPLSVTPGEKQLRVLLVDDHPDTLRILSRLLQKWGYSVMTADCVRRAIDCADGERFDVLISDLGLPDGSGLDIMRYVKETYSMPGIALSGYGTEEDIRQSREAGFHEHLIKPVGFEALQKTLQAVLSR